MQQSIANPLNLTNIGGLQQRFYRKKSLGRGSYGKVLLVQDNSHPDKKQYALKVLNKSFLQKADLLEYLQSQIQCMRTSKSPYIVKLFETFEDQDKIYLLLEYCQGKDLLRMQSLQPGMVFTLENAIQILVQVIKGLYDLHSAGYLHRDIKPQNILVAKEGQKYVYKLADFGFSKKTSQITGTICGTPQFISPDMFKPKYGFQIDMWSFGVLFFFMLNAQYPFKINPSLPWSQKVVLLNRLSSKFSYKQSVAQTMKKITINCTNEVQDLFCKIFTPQNGQHRLTFTQLRQHSLFSKYFSNQELNQSHNFYKNQYVNSLIQNIRKQKKQSGIGGEQNQISGIQGGQRTVLKPLIIYRQSDRIYSVHKKILTTKMDEIDFLLDNAQYFNNEQLCNYIDDAIKFPLVYNLYKLYIILLKRFNSSLTETQLSKTYGNLQWKQYCKSKSFKDFKIQCQQYQAKAQAQFQRIYNKCTYIIDEIIKIQPQFQRNFKLQINQQPFPNNQMSLSDESNRFKQSYRLSTIGCYNHLVKHMEQRGTSGNKMYYNLALILISHVFNQIFDDRQKINIIFKDYFANQHFGSNQKDKEFMNYEKLRKWLEGATKQQLKYIVVTIQNKYFKKQN